MKDCKSILVDIASYESKKLSMLDISITLKPL